MSRKQFVFVDFENVQKLDLDLLAGKTVAVELIVGEQDTKLHVDMVEQLRKYPDVEIVKAGKSGRNALDFVLAYRVGVVSSANKDGFFHIVSRDTGFDALIRHLRKKEILARRDETFAKAFVTETPVVAPEDRVKFVRERLEKNKANRPKRKKTLLSQSNAYFGKKLTEAELEKIVQTLIHERVIEVGEKGDVSYLI
jgi:hypothetical protein